MVGELSDDWAGDASRIIAAEAPVGTPNSRPDRSVTEADDMLPVQPDVELSLGRVEQDPVNKIMGFTERHGRRLVRGTLIHF